MTGHNHRKPGNAIKTSIPEEKGLIEVIGMYYELLHNIEGLITIFALNNNRFIWFNPYAQKFFPKKILKDGLSEFKYLREYLSPENHFWWHQRKENVLLFDDDRKL